MHLEHPDLPGRRVRLGYCMNLHPAEDLDGVLAGLADVTVPLAERGALARLASFLGEHRLDAFTFNAFPVGGFHRAGLKADVFRPTWLEPARAAFTRDVARVACALAAPGEGHVSISTHAGGLGAWIADDATRDAVARALAELAAELARLEAETGVRVVLAVEPEPRSSANDTRELEALLARARRVAREPAALERHLGACLDACHAAVEFEEPRAAFARVTGAAPFGKLQVSSALALPDPGNSPAGRAALRAMAEPVYLHQVTGRPRGLGDGEREPDGAVLLRLADLPELDRPPEGAATWEACDEWRCHFHVPVDRDAFQAPGATLRTTRPAARAALAAALAAPDRWGSPELHVEVETYTWDVLPGEGSTDRVTGLERELRAVLADLSAAGWHPRESSPRTV